MPSQIRVISFLQTAIILFELGSLVCAVAKNMNVLIFGRAFSGVGAAGIFSSVIAIIAEIAPIEKVWTLRPLDWIRYQQLSPHFSDPCCSVPLVPTLRSHP